MSLNCAVKSIKEKKRPLKVKNDHRSILHFHLQPQFKYSIYVSRQSDHCSVCYRQSIVTTLYSF